MLSIANEVNLLFFPLGMFCMRYKHVFFQQDCHGLEIGGKGVEVFSDSRLVVGQVRGELEARYSRM